MRNLTKVLFTNYPINDSEQFSKEVAQINHVRSVTLSKFLLVVSLLMYLISVFEDDLKIVKHVNFVYFLSCLGIFILFMVLKSKKDVLIRFNFPLVMAIVVVNIIWGSSLMAFAPNRYEMYGTYSIVMLSMATIFYFEWKVIFSIYFLSLLYIFITFIIVGDFFFADPVIPKITVIISLNLLSLVVSRTLYYNYLKNFELNSQLKKHNDTITSDLLRNKETLFETQESLEKISSQNTALINAMPDILFILSNDGVILDFRAQDITSLYEKPELFVGKKIVDIVPKDIGLEFESKMKNLKKLQTLEYSLLMDNITKYYEARIIGSGNDQIVCIIRETTEKRREDEHIKQLNKELTKSQTLFKSNLESANDFVISAVDVNYDYLYFNQTHKQNMKMLYNVDIELGSNLLESILDDENRQRSKANHEIAFLGKSHSVIEEYGSVNKIVYEISYNPILNNTNEIMGVSIFAKDITERITVNNALIASEQKYKMLTDMLPLGLVHYQVKRIEETKKIEFIFLGMNRVFEDLIGIKSTELVGKNIWDVFPNTEPYWIEIFEDVASTGKHQVFEDYFEATDGYLRIYAYKIETDKMAVVLQDITADRKKEKEIEYLSYHDPLTKLYNRRFFEEQLERLDNPRNLPLSVIMGDVNGLKLVNDAFGHQIGDQLLKSIGKVISDSIRGNDIAARWGGDEFAILMPSSDADAAQVLIDRIQAKIKESSFDYGSLSISFGIETKTSKNEDINDIFKSAETLMYQNKIVEKDSIRGETINTIMNTLFEKSPEVKEHSTRVLELAVSIGETMGLSQAKVNDIRTIGMIHDIGKIAIDLQILDKPEELTEAEKTIVQQHPLSGSRMLSSSHEYSRLAVGVLHHHERIDGKGYPNGISGDQIPIESKIIAVADAFDAMTAQRPYRLNPLTMEQAISELQKHSGTQFDSEIVKVFVEYLKK